MRSCRVSYIMRWIFVRKKLNHFICIVFLNWSLLVVSPLAKEIINFCFYSVVHHGWRRSVTFSCVNKRIKRWMIKIIHCLFPLESLWSIKEERSRAHSTWSQSHSARVMGNFLLVWILYKISLNIFRWLLLLKDRILSWLCLGF